MHPDSQRLFALDEALRAEADRMLAQSGIGPILRESGYKAVLEGGVRGVAEFREWWREKYVNQ